MEKIRICFTLLMFAMTSCAFAAEYNLVKDGQATSCIVLPDNVSPAEKHAANELALFLEKVTGAKVKIENTPAKDLYNIYLGTTGAKNVPRSEAIDKAVSQLKDDGFVLAADKEGVRIISKKPAGVLFGAYEILKKYAGLRWFAPGAEFEYFAKKQTVSVPEQVTSSNPSFKVRGLSCICADLRTPITNTWDWMVRNGMPVTVNKGYYIKSELLRNEADKRGVEFGREGGHCFATLLSDSLFAEHPEYFALIDGKRTPQDIGDGKGARRQPCTSNPKVAEIMTASLNKILDTPLKGGCYLIGNNDAPNWCQCAECVKLDPPEEKQKGFVSTRYWTLVNKIAEGVYKVHPDTELWGWGYQNFQYPPTGIVPDPRLTVQFCVHGRCHRHPMSDLACAGAARSNEKYRDILVRWGKLKNTICVLEYLGGDCGFPAYVPFEKSHAEDIKYYKKIGLGGVTMFMVAPDSNLVAPWNTPYYREEMLTAWQMYYITAQLLWNVDADYDAIYEDMGSKYYGQTWPVMKEYRALLTKSFMEVPGHLGDCTPQYFLGKCLDKPGVETRLLQLLDEAEKLAGGDQTAKQRVQRDREYLHKYWSTKQSRELLTQKQKKININKRVDAIVIDGKLDEADWKKAEAQTGFIIADLNAIDKTTADPQTFVRMLYGDDNIYFAVEAMESAPGKMKTTVNERDGSVWSDNSLEIFIIVSGMDRKYAQIVINAGGVIYDSLVDPGVPADIKFDSGVEAKTSVAADRWVAEIRVPAAALGCKIKNGDTWKINVARSRRLIDGTSQSSSWCKGVFHGPDEYRPVVLGGQ